MRAHKAIHHILAHCGGLSRGETVYILHDDTTQDIAQEFWAIAENIGATPYSCKTIGGKEPSKLIAASIKKVDLTVSLCQQSLAHTRARQRAKRFLSLPGYSFELLENPAVMVDYEAQAPNVRRFADAFTNGNEIRVVAEGTNVTMDITGRGGNYCPGFVRRHGDLGSPPDIEANVAPIEGSVYGFAKFISPAMETDKFDDIAECGVGLNPKAALPGPLLIEEGAFGCVHFGFGSNHTIGGRRDVGYHYDCIIPNASLWVDGIQMLKNGELCN